MSDLFGLLPLPAPVPETGDALTDPTLDVLLAFMKAVLNADLSDAWASRCATDRTLVAHTFAHNPDLESFNDDETPAIYLWRADDNGGSQVRYSADHIADDSGFVGLWVPPRLQQEDKRFVEPIRNGIKKSLTRAFAAGRHPAWVVDDDEYADAETYGSVLLRHAGLAQIRVGQFRAFTLPIESEDRGFKQNYECLLFTLPALEFLKPGNDDAVALNGVQGVSKLPESTTIDEMLEMVSPGETLTFDFSLTFTSVSPASGTAAGGDVIELSGSQFIDGARVFFGTARVPDEDVTVQDESTILVVTPAHAVGAVNVTIEQQEGGASKTLSNAFTYL